MFSHFFNVINKFKYNWTLFANYGDNETFLQQILRTYYTI